MSSLSLLVEPFRLKLLDGLSQTLYLLALIHKHRLIEIFNYIYRHELIQSYLCGLNYRCGLNRPSL